MFIQPMLSKQVEKPFLDTNWIHEPKIDGHRLIMSRINGEVKLYTRHRTDVTDRYPELHDIPGSEDIILDGEVACVDPDTGKIDFELVMSRFHTKGKDKISASMKRLPVSFVVFDILHYRGEDLRSWPLLKRKELLEKVLPDTSAISKTWFVDGDGQALFEVVKQHGMEGIVSKKKDSLYVGKKSDSWMKLINYQYAIVYISGYRKKEFGWLTSVLGSNGSLRPAGIIELGVPPKHKKAFYGISNQIVKGEDKDFIHLEPLIQAKVKFRNWTRSGMLRSPVFVDFEYHVN